MKNVDEGAQRRQVIAVMTWEFKRFFKWKQDLMSYAVMLIILLGISLWQSHIADNDNKIQIAVSSEIELPNHERFKVSSFTAKEFQSMRDRVGEEFDAIVYSEDNQMVIFVSEKDKWLSSFKSWMSQVAQTEKLNLAGISGDDLKLIMKPYNFKLKVKGVDENNDGKSNAALMTMILLMVGVFTAFGFAFTSITSEKQQRVTEQLLSTMSAQTWIDGKIYGITLLCLKSLMTASLSMFIFYQINAILNGTDTTSLGVEFSHILWMVLFAILGLLMWNSLLAGFAATIDDPNHSSRTILMLLPAVPIFLAYSLADAPQSMTMQFMSYFPLTSFAAMPIRMAEASIPIWQILLSVFILFAAIYVFRKVASRLFNMGVMMYGKEPGIKEMMTAILNRHHR